jgi:hypothetical protein
VAIRKSSSSGIPFGNDANRPANPQIGQPYFNGQSSRLELYTQATGWQNIVQETPAVVNIVGQLNQSTSSTLTINGTNFAVGAVAYAIGSDSTETAATTTTLVSVVEISAVFPPLNPAYEPYDIKVVNPSNLYGILYDAVGVNNAPVWSTSAGTLGTFTELQSVSISIAATDATDSTNSPLSYSIVSGSLPPGLSLNSSTGLISGTLSSNVITNTTYSFTAAVTDGRNTAVTRAFSITVNDRDPVWSTGTTLPSFTRNVAYSTTVSATEDDSGAITYSLVSGTLPSGFSLSSAGVISGTTTSSTNATITIRATVTASGTTSDRTFTLPNAGPVWNTAAGTITLFYGATSQLSATDDSGSAPTYSVVSGTLPSGTTISSSGLITAGNTSGSPSITVRASDANGSFSDRTFTINTTAPIGGTLYQTPGTYSWTAPTGVTSVKVVAIGGGGSGSNGNGGNGGGGGGLGWKNNIAVTPGQSYTVVVGSGGGRRLYATQNNYIEGIDGTSSYFISTGTVAGNGGSRGLLSSSQTNAAGGTYVGDGGGNGGAGGRDYSGNQAGPGGGGGGGYSGAGGQGGDSGGGIGGGQPGQNGSGGGGGGGGAGGGGTGFGGGGGGGTGVYGQGSNGQGGGTPGQSGSGGGYGATGGSGGTSGSTASGSQYGGGGDGGFYGAGGGGTNDGEQAGNFSGAGGKGAVRIIWGDNRSFPSTNVEQNYGGYSETVI